jgi:hypothetical protein
VKEQQKPATEAVVRAALRRVYASTLVGAARHGMLAELRAEDEDAEKAQAYRDEADSWDRMITSLVDSPSNFFELWFAGELRAGMRTKDAEGVTVQVKVLDEWRTIGFLSDEQLGCTAVELSAGLRRMRGGPDGRRARYL